jgi:branched-chain amino acid transport system ATP-binding protein
MSAPILETHNLAINFGGVVAVDHVDFALPQAQLRCVIGPNGAGKTTFFNLLTGRLKPNAGTVIFNGDDITGWTTYRRIRKGMSRTFQISNLYNQLSVDENVRLAAQRKHEPYHPLRKRSDLEGVDAQVRLALDQIGLWEKRAGLTGNLSHGERRKASWNLASR